MNQTWNIILTNIKAAKVDKARCARECTGEKSGGYYARNSIFDYTIEAKVIAKIVESNSAHFSNTFYAKMKDHQELSSKQAYALASAFNEVEVSFGDVKKAIADAGYDITEDFMFEDTTDDYGYDFD